ncbi:MAG: sensor domain-containing diguanylate cyclase [Acetatifactor sp.]
MKKFSKTTRMQAKLFFTIIPVTVFIILLFILLTRYKVLELSKENLVMRSQKRVLEINDWAENVLNELNIYKRIVDEMGIDKEETFEILKTSYQANPSYPYGLYWGDINGSYFDSSDWEPGPDYIPSQREWYQEGLEHNVFTFGSPYVDALTHQTCVSATVRTGKGEKESVLSADVYLDYASQLVKEIIGTDVVKSAFFVSKDHTIIVSSDDSMLGISLDSEELSPLYSSIRSLLYEKRTGLNRVTDGKTAYYVYINVVENTGWYFVSCMRWEDILGELRQVEIPMALIGILAAVFIVIMTRNIANELSLVNRKAKTDPLTRILNRDGFREMVMLGMEAHPNQGVMLIIDMDNFKLVNDQMGHPEGDEVLKHFAALLDKYFNRNKDITARIGGDEFAVFVGREISETETENMLRKFMDIFHADYDSLYPDQHLSVSIGGAVNRDNISYEELYKKADKALYRVKEKGKNGFGF